MSSTEPTVTDLQTDLGLSVLKRIEKGLTRAFTSRTEAAAYALSTGSYVYDLMGVTKKGHKYTTSHYGYAVPN